MYGHGHRLLPMADYALINLHSYPFLQFERKFFVLFDLVLYFARPKYYFTLL